MSRNLAPRDDEGPKKSPILDRGLACLTSYRFSSTFPSEEKTHLKFLYPGVCGDHDNLSFPFETCDANLLYRTGQSTQGVLSSQTGPTDAPASLALDGPSQRGTARNHPRGRRPAGFLLSAHSLGVESYRMSQMPIELILLRQLAGFLVMPIFIVDKSGTLLFYNESAELILGRRFEETGALSKEELERIFKPTDE